jgi:hypothetical protein
MFGMLFEKSRREYFGMKLGDLYPESPRKFIGGRKLLF